MLNIPSSLKDVTERAASTGWQVAAGYVIAENVFHDITLTPIVAAVLSVAKCAAVWFYSNHKPAIDRNVGDVDELAAELKPIVEQMMAEMAAQTVGVALPAPVAVAVTPAPALTVAAPAAVPAVKQPPFLRK